MKMNNSKPEMGREPDSATENDIKSIVLLSGITPSKSTHLPTGENPNGMFTSIGRGFGNLRTVVRLDLDGEDNHRESIPDIRSQEICYLLALCKPRANMEKSDIMQEPLIAQWCGALAMAILHPILFPNDSALEWKEIRLSDKQSNSFLNSVYEISTLSGGETTWNMLCIQDQNAHGRKVPVLMYSLEAVVVPAASQEGLMLARPYVPWIHVDDKSTATFTNPLEKMSVFQMEIIEDVLIKIGTARPPQVGGMIEWFLLEVKKTKKSTQKVEQTEKLSERILQGLLLRDVEDMGFHIEKVNIPQPQGDISKLFFPEPFLKQKEQWSIQYQDQRAGFLHETDLIWCFYVENLTETNLFNGKEKEKLEELKALIHDRLDDLPAFRECPFIAKMREDEPSATVEQYVYSLRQQALCLKGQPELEEPYQGLNLLLNEFSDPSMIFIKRIAVYKLPDQEGAGTVSLIHPDIETEAWSKISEAGTSNPDRAIIPLTVRAGHMLNYCKKKRYQVKVELKQKENSIVATLWITRNRIRYTYEQEYQAVRDVIPLTFEALPEIAMWPDRRENESTAQVPGWTEHFSFVHYGVTQENDAEYYKTYLHFGDELGGDKSLLQWEFSYIPDQLHGVNYNTLERWQTYLTKKPPAFFEIRYKGQPLGIVPCNKLKTFENSGEKAWLAIDFGTTTTAGAVCIGSKDEAVELGRIEDPCYHSYTIAWFMNSQKGKSASERFFLPERLNKDNSMLTTAVKRFEPAANKRKALEHYDMFYDGHIHFVNDDLYSSTANGIDHCFSRFKIVDPQNPSIYLSNTRLFLKQILLMYLLHCRYAGATEVDIRFALPSDMENREQYREVFRTLAKEMTQKAGIQLAGDNVMVASESQAVSAFFSHQQGYGFLNHQVGILTMDIGGGTTDYSFVGEDVIQISASDDALSDATAIQKSNVPLQPKTAKPRMQNKRPQPEKKKTEKPTLIEKYYSSKLAGQAMLGEVLYKYLQSGTDTSWLIKAFKESENGLREPDKKFFKNYQDALLTFMPQSSASTENEERVTEDQFLTRFDQFAKLLPVALTSFLYYEGNRFFRDMMILEFGLLFWFARVLLESTLPKNTEKKKQERHVCLAGNGSRYFWLLSEDDKDMIIKLAIGNNNYCTLIPMKSVDYKKEVARGLLLLADDVAESNWRGRTNSQLTPDAMWECFKGFITRYRAYRNQNGHPLPTPSAYEQDFRAKVKDERTLCSYLIEYRNIILRSELSVKTMNASSEQTS